MDVWAEYLGDSRREVSRGHKGLEKPNGAWGSTQGQKSDKPVPSKTMEARQAHYLPPPASQQKDTGGFGAKQESKC